MTDFKAPIRDIEFVLNELMDVQGHYEGLNLQDINKELTDAVITEGAKFAETALAPYNRSGDEEGITFENGEVTTPTGFKEAYQQYCDNGWASMTSNPEFGGQDLPNSLATPIHEMIMAANLSWRIYSGLTEGATLAIDKHGDQALKDTYLEKMITGQWSGTMCLTEPHAGTDLGILRTKAEPNADGSYSVTGTKIFISGGEHDMAENIVHLVLAKLPDAPGGSKGISLFLVPKFLPDANGNPGEKNTLSCGSVEHKMGIKAAATCVMNFEGSKGYIVGGEHKGLACMFTMMNDARFQVGLQGLGIAEMACQGAIEYARDRIQTRSLSGPKFPEKAADPIIVHPDVRRMLLTQKALTEGSRMLAYYTAKMLDNERFLTDEAEEKANAKKLAFFIPIVKSFLTDISQEVSSLAVQVYGGHGFIREWGMEQLMRDSRILMLYEGTNGIQALDFISRKVLGDGGTVLNGMADEIDAFIAANQGAPLVDQLAAGTKKWRELLQHILAATKNDPEEIGAVSVDFLQYSSYLLLGYFWAQASVTAQAKLDAGSTELDFYKGKVHTAEFYFARILPRADMHASALLSGANNLMEITSEMFA